MNKKTLLIALLFFVLYPCLSFSVGIPITSSITTIKSQANDVNISVITVKMPSEYPYDKTSMWGGDEENLSLPKKIIHSVTVFKNKQKIFIPLSAYSDLGDPNYIELKSLSGKKFQLIITGSDAAGSYKAILEFENNEIWKRKVVSGEFPDDAWEETKYKFNHLNN